MQRRGSRDRVRNPDIRVTSHNARGACPCMHSHSRGRSPRPWTHTPECASDDISGYPAEKSCRRVCVSVFHDEQRRSRFLERADVELSAASSRERDGQRDRIPRWQVLLRRVCACVNSASDTVPLRRCMCFKMKTENRCGGYIVRWRFAEMHDFRARTCAYSEC